MNLLIWISGIIKISRWFLDINQGYSQESGGRPTWAPLHWKRSHWTQKGIAARRLLPTCAIPCFTSSAVGRGSFAVMKNAVRGPPESCTLRIFAFARIFGKRTTPNESQKGLIAKCDSPFVKRCEIRGWRFSGYPLSKRQYCQRRWQRV